MRAAIYARVSSDKQRENFSIVAQIQSCKQYCLKNNLSIFKEYVDDGYTSKNGNRPAFQEMINNSKEFDLVIVHTFDRFASNVELSKSAKRKLKENKVNVISISEPVENNPFGFVMETLIEAMDEARLIKLAMHVKKGQLQMIKEGYNHGASCYGYKMVNKKLVIYEPEAEIVRIIFKMYLEGYGCQKIQKWLNNNNILTRRGKNFEFARVNRILQNPKYIGKLQYEGKIYEGKHDPIISEKDYYSVQEALKNNRCGNYINHDGPIMSRRSERWYKYYLLSILYCGECGANMRIVHCSTRKYAAYSCGKALRYTNACNFTKNFEVKKIEAEIEEILYDYMQGKVKFISKVNYSDSKREILMKRYNKIPDQIERIEEAFISGLINIDKAKSKKSELSEEYNKITEELENMRNNDFDVMDLQGNMKNIWDIFINESDILKKRELLRKVVHRIYVYKDKKIEIIFQAD